MEGERAKSEYEEYLAGGYRFNIVVNILDVGLYFFALHIVSATIVLPVFMLRLGASDFLIALLPAIQVVGMRLPQIIVPFFVEGRPRLKPWVMAMGVAQRLPWLLMVPLTLILAGSRPGLLLALFMLCYLACNIGLGVSHPAWGDFVAKVIPERVRGSFMGLNMMIGNAGGVLGGYIIAFIMESGQFPYPHNYATIFLLTSVLFWMSLGCFALSREPVVPVAGRPAGVRAYLRSLVTVLRDDRRFRNFIVYQTLFYSFVMAVGLFMAYAVKTFSLSDEKTGHFVTASAVALLIASPILGVLGDKLGHKAVLVLSTLAHVAATATAMLATRWEAMYAVFILSGISMTAWIISMRNLIYIIAPPNRRATYIALSGTIPAPFVMGFSMLAGWLCNLTPLGYHLPFAISIALSVAAALVLVLAVRPDNR